MKRDALWIPVVMLAVFGCNHTEPLPAEVPKAPAITSTAAAGTPQLTSEAAERTFGDVRLTIPAGWESKPPASDLLIAEYHIPHADGSARVTFSSAGGGAEANVKRWREQFTPGADDPAAQETTESISGHEVHVVEFFGTFQDGFAGKSVTRHNWSMLGAVYPLPATNFFVKVTGPQSTLAAHREELLTMIRSAKLPN